MQGEPRGCEVACSLPGPAATGGSAEVAAGRDAAAKADPGQQPDALALTAVLRAHGDGGGGVTRGGGGSAGGATAGHRSGSGGAEGGAAHSVCLSLPGPVPRHLRGQPLSLPGDLHAVTAATLSHAQLQHVPPVSSPFPPHPLDTHGTCPACLTGRGLGVCRRKALFTATRLTVLWLASNVLKVSIHLGVPVPPANIDPNIVCKRVK